MTPKYDLTQGEAKPRAEPSLRWLMSLVIAIALALPLRADNAKSAPINSTGNKELKAAQKPKSDKWVFSFLPVGLQRNPQVEFTIITEMTDEGRKLPEPSFSKPVYYISHSVGQRDVGGSYAGTRPIQYKYLENQLNNALASNGYRQADLEHPATQVIFIAWGMHNRVVFADNEADAFAGDDESEADIDSGIAGTYTVDTDDFENLLSRAKTIGGRKFAREFADALVQQRNWNGKLNADALGPLSDFAGRDETTGSLVYQVFGDCYYLLVTSFDLEALKRNEKKVLWTTKISTASLGIAFESTLPNMIENGAYYFGRDMPEPDIIRKRAQKKATVTIGEATVEEYIMPSGTKAPSATSGTAPPAKP
jgi:hypothetical protein